MIEIKTYISGVREKEAPRKIRWIIHNLARKPDLDRGRVGVTVSVVATSSGVVDILFNGISLGYFGIRNICKTLGLRLSGPFQNLKVPLFGVIQ
jgi:hypothetical protein